MAKKTAPKKKKKAKRKIKQGLVNIKATYNNTLITVSDMNGNALASSSPGRVGFTGTRKATPYAAQQATAHLVEQIKPYGLEEIGIVVKGIGSARESVIRSLNAAGLNILFIRDKTPIPHNGVRAPKRRRV